MKTKAEIELEAMIAQLRAVAMLGGKVSVDADKLLVIMENIRSFRQQWTIIDSIAEEMLCDHREMIPVPRETLLLLAGKAGTA